MSSTFDQIANIIAETCDIPRETITPESHSINDLGIDSLDFLDIAFAIDKAFGIKMPLEKWTQEVNDGKATTEQYFVLKNLCRRASTSWLRPRTRHGGRNRPPSCRSNISSSSTGSFDLDLDDEDASQSRRTGSADPARSSRGTSRAIR